MAFNDLEAKANEENGWKTVTEEDFYAEHGVSHEISEETDDLRPALEAAYEVKFGKKPPKNIGTETLKAKLED